ncbi:MAG: type II secretion system protein [Alkalibacterium sp.]|nr:type II secretion system protein [Alkalibacterium sp.]
MRNKIKQMMNKEEGFTLVELLAVIVILGIILAIAIPSVGSLINRASGDAEAAEDALVIDAARLYFTAIDEEEHKNTVDVSELRSQGFLEHRETDEDGAIVDFDGTVTRTPSTTTDGEVPTYTYNFVRD